MYQQRTNNIVVSVTPVFLDEQSSPAEGRYVWAYTVSIENIGDETVQLIDRYWKITDERGHVQEVAGPGVVGEQPVIAPGDSYTYTSGCPLPTPSGFMQGHYGMQNGAGERFRAQIPAFSLDMPQKGRRTLN
ncbi:Co2+/Mg2+ efflux protein ApaG [Fulvimarina sp. 2208YS6-2-32]|uniref:Protein ApaG n=1 Tax=Fulvimarina uroteuthidis TaxID=3098149 RepID=A0ABU5HZW6_9HYPH|nr:Co2+/Mg2+ efflux protein ApaG [Fulvimarina sp. 2208YS6-2-32]MDY8108675.1 Co2+/Mg2+ efflux protein ApaG [Fulvimarina sp. 2208YS6-2-32]